MDHFDEVPGAGGPDSSPSLVRCGSEGLKDRSEAIYRVDVAADHHRVALFEAPDTAGRAAVDELEAFGGLLGVATLRVLVVGIAAVDEGIAFLHEGLQPGDGLVDGSAGGDHDPDGSGRLEAPHELLDGVDAE